jgi:phage/plasmid-like protein (TIGR03299 family)
MSHEVESMISVNEVPWHGLGVILKDPPANVEEALVASGLNWGVDIAPNFATYKGKTLQTPSFSVVRDSDDKVLGTVGPDYHPITNAKAFKFFDPFLERGECTIETAGSLKGGRRVWMLAKIKGAEAEIVNGDPVNGYFLLSNSHDGSLRARLGFCGIRVVCSNTMAEAHTNSDLIKVAHTKNAEVALEKLQDIVDFQKRRFSATVEQMREMARLGVTADSLRKYVERVFLPEVKARTVCDEDATAAIDKIHAKIIPLFEKGRGNDLPGVKGTMWAAYNAVSEHLTWDRGRSVSTRLDGLWFGGEAAKINQRAFVQALAA